MNTRIDIYEDGTTVFHKIPDGYSSDVVVDGVGEPVESINNPSKKIEKLSLDGSVLLEYNFEIQKFVADGKQVVDEK